MSESTPAQGASWPQIRTVIGTLCRVVMAGIFIYAGYSKIINIPLAKLSVESYQIFPREIAETIGVVLPILEIALGLLLLVGVGTRIVAAILCIMLVVFIMGIASLWIRGINTQCGCFGTTLLATGRPNFALEILRDTLMLLATAWLVRWPRTLFSIDGVLSRGSGDAAEDDESDTDDIEDDERGTGDEIDLSDATEARST